MSSPETTPPTENIPYVIFISLVAVIGGFLFGFDSGVINGTVDGLKVAFHSDSIGTGFNVASMLLGCAVGAFFAGRLADVFGRKACLLVSAVFFTISAWGSGIAMGSGEFVFYRVLGGFAVGAASVLSPAYISEVTPARFRGALSSLQQVAIIAGLFFSFLSNYLIAQSATSALEKFWFGYEAWRWMFWMELVPCAVFLVALLFIPESPRYLVARRKHAAALTVLTRLLGATAAQAKVEEIDRSLAADHHKPGFKDLLDRNTGRVRRIVWVGIGLAVFQQLTGINVVFYYGAVLWQAAGFTEAHALLINVISGAVSIAACVITIFVIDRLGRKPLLWLGSLTMALALAAMALAFYSAGTDAAGRLVLEGRSGVVALVAANLYVFFFNISWGPVMWVMLGEMFPNQVRGAGLAVSGLAQWVANFAITMTFPLLLSGVGLGNAYVLYAVFGAISFFFVIRSVHETKGLELEQMKG